MKNYFSRIVDPVLLLSSLSLVLLNSAYADQVLTIGTPQNAGKVTLTVNYLSLDAVEVEVDIPAGTNRLNKANLIRDKLKADPRLVDSNGVPYNAIVDLDANTGAVTLTLPGFGTHIADTTKEPDLATEKKPGKMSIDYHTFGDTPLSGFDQNGLESVFQSSFGFDGVTVDSSFNFSDLSGNTVDDLLRDTYLAFLTDLPTGYWQNVSLDLLNDEIFFTFPDWANNGFVANYTSDTNAYTSMGITTRIAEPSLLSLLAIAAIGLGVTKRSGKRWWV